LIKESFNKLINSDFDSVFPVVKYSYPIQRALHFVSENIQMIWPENFTMRSQDLADSYHDAGMFYWIEIDSLYMHKRLWTEKSGAIIVSETMAHDIDTYEDWKVAEVKYKMLNEIK
jgi:N-acylneuraminate cytidylyltransferase